jgi:hypothetical protein
MTKTQVAGSPSSCAPAPPDTNIAIVPTTSNPTIQPNKKAGPFDRARGVPSIRTTAMIGTGLSATPTAIGRTVPIAVPI